MWQTGEQPALSNASMTMSTSSMPQRSADKPKVKDGALVGGKISADTAQRRVFGRPFQKGQSGNPGGKPKQAKNLADIARDAAPEAVNTLIAIMKDKTASAAVRAYCADKVIDRAYGKAPQTTSLSVSGSQRSLRELSDAELMRIIEGDRAPATPPPALPAPGPATLDAEALPPIVVEDAEADAA